MTFVAEFTIPSVEFSFGSVLREHSELTIEFERVVPTYHGFMPFVFAWARSTTTASSRRSDWTW